MLQSDDGSESPKKVSARTKLPVKSEEVIKKGDYAGMFSSPSHTMVYC